MMKVPGYEEPVADGPAGTGRWGFTRMASTDGFSLGPERLPEADLYTVLSNRRRRETLAELLRKQDEVSVRELSEVIAAKESGERPAPRKVRESVYVSLHQTHLPTLDENGLIEYDINRKVVHPCRRTRDVGPYMDVRTAAGVSWVGLYQWLGILGLFAMVAAVAEAPFLETLPPLLIGSIFLGLFALASVLRLWRVRGEISRLVGHWLR